MPGKFSPLPLADYSGNGPDWRTPVAYHTHGLSTNLERLYWANRQGALAEASRRSFVRLQGDRVLVTIIPRQGQLENATEAAKGMGASIAAKGVTRLDAWVPLPAIRALAQHRSVLRVDEVLPMLPDSAANQGVPFVHADQWQSAGLTGRGVKVGVIDVSFLGYDDPAKLGTVLPANAADAYHTQCTQAPLVNLGLDGNQAHGTAVAEVIHDMAPDAELFLARADTFTDSEAAIRCLASLGVRIINHSANDPGYYGPGDGTDGTGRYDSYVDLAVNQSPSIFWSNSSGNWAPNHWGGPWVDADDNTFMEFGNNGEFLPIQLGPNENVRIELRWEEPDGAGGLRWDQACSDYDLLLSTQPSHDPQFQVGAGAHRQQCQSGDNPHEALEYPGTPDGGTFYISAQTVRADPGNPNYRPQQVDILAFKADDSSPLQVSVPAGSLLHPADSRSDGMVAVGASYAPDFGSVWSDTCLGPTTDNRHKPDLIAPSNVANSSYGQFGGTSAASPHVAGAAALVLQANPGFTAQEIKTFLVERTRDLWQDGYSMLDMGALSPYLLSVVADHPLSYWRLNDVAGSPVRDLSVNHLDGTVAGTPGSVTNSVDGALSAVGDGDRAMLFSGTDGYISLPSGFSDLADGVTMEAWVYPTTNANWSRIIELGNGSGGDNIILGRNGDSPDLTFQVYNGTNAGAVITAPGILQLNVWQHMAATVDGAGNATIYWNGQRVAAGQTGIPRNVVRSTNYIGRGSDSRYFAGSIDEVTVYPSALAASRIQDHYSKGTPPPQPVASAYRDAVLSSSPAGYWRLDEVAGALAQDSSNRGNTGYYNGTLIRGVDGALTTDQDEAVQFPNSGYVTLLSGFGDFTQGMTMEAWVKPSGITNCGTIIELGRSGQDRVMFRRSGTSTSLEFMVFRGGSIVGTVTAPGLLAYSDWQHVVASMDSSGNVTIYSNGDRVARGDIPPGDGGPVINNVERTNNYIGKDADAPLWAGYIDEVAIYQSVLSSADILRHYQVGTGQ